ncbi:hypothetical protein T12_16363 [Trichinella patagoniensis]|uniref:Uncharacterized protein n=1 Tax=Trichinella patagoniensis TaxID=990121 RepID=A0A0V1AA30_9BILA|nr:hypothetical protein T12_16363 [Trichinella patagoniensis]
MQVQIAHKFSLANSAKLVAFLDYRTLTGCKNFHIDQSCWFNRFDEAFMDVDVYESFRVTYRWWICDEFPGYWPMMPKKTNESSKQSERSMILMLFVGN